MPIPDITYWWHEQQETHSKLANLANVERDTLSLIPYGVGAECGFSLGQDDIRWRL